MSYIRNRLTNTMTLIVLTVLATMSLLHSRATRRSKNDQGSMLEYVIIAAGVTVLAISVVAWIGPVVMKYLSRIT